MPGNEIPLRPANARNLSDRISDLIVSGDYPPGARLDESELAERFGVSRTPVREALHQLSATGLIVMRPRRATIVRQLTSNELAQAFEALGEMEALCAKYCAERMTRAERIELRDTIEAGRRVVDVDDFKAYREIDAKLHRLIHSGTHNDVISRATRQLRLQTAPYGAAPYTVKYTNLRLRDPHDQHEAIVDAICDHDPGRAHSAMLDHISLSGLTIRRIIERDRILKTAT